MIHYVLGFAFNTAQTYVVLIKKNKPEWQKGSFNGVGGKVEKGETAEQAMIREFEEETGIATYENEWQDIGVMQGENWKCDIFTLSDDELMAATTSSDEEISIFEVQEVVRGDYPVISNVPFLIELCRDESRPKTVSLQY